MSLRRRSGFLSNSYVMYWKYVLFINFISVTHTSQMFKDATLFFSRMTPNLATMIPAMDHIDTHFATVSQDLKF
jgi:hypothetical protein